ncbi:oligoribonuclease [Euzebya sp.]|uniref:oligoribonuclease n=1 Tax=Euzebya sp. TaxID=1971409 RepID=UPI003518039C
MTTSELSQPLVWVDLEMTGLDPDAEVIVEIAAIVTDGALETVIEGPDLVIGADEDVLGRMRPRVKEMHRRSGLMPEIRASELTVAEAEAQVLEFVTAHVPLARTAPLAGNSVHADRAFLKRYMPDLEAHVHYRNVDVSTIKELARRWYPDVLEAAPAKDGGHRALADIRGSIDELRYYRSTVFRG